MSDITWSTGGKEITVCRRRVACLVSVGNDSPGQRVKYTCTAENVIGRDVEKITFEGEGYLLSYFSGCNTSFLYNNLIHFAGVVEDLGLVNTETLVSVPSAIIHGVKSKPKTTNQNKLDLMQIINI